MTSTDKTNGTSYGPSLPSSARIVEAAEEINEVCGPALPPHMLNKSLANTPQQTEEKRFTSCSDDEEKEDDEIYGPLPLEATFKSKSHLALEERALQMKIDLLNPERTTKESREEWMIELPDTHKTKLGLGPRQFRPNPRPDMSDRFAIKKRKKMISINFVLFRSSWTDTPTNKKKKTDETSMDHLRKQSELKEVLKRDSEQEKLATKAKEKRKGKEKSLLELHQEKLKKKKRKTEEDNVRRPFSRETDLQVNRFDEAQKKSVMKKAQLLNDRFSAGKAKYL